MAESDVLKKEDVEEITDVLQVAPHQKNNQFSAVSKSETGDLVSLDELYEKTGQEAINKFIDGFRELAENNRLSREHGLALNIQGAENWIDLPDTYNALIGKESFLGAIKKGIVAIVKAIIAFVKGVCNWIYTRISSLLGFSRTVKETRYIYENSTNIRAHCTKVLMSLKFSEFDANEFLDSLEKNLTQTEIFLATKNKIDSNEKMFERLSEVQALLACYPPTINGWNKHLRNAKRASDSNIAQLRKLLGQKNNPITEADILDIVFYYSTIIKENLNPEKPIAYLNELLDLTYGIEIDGLGLQGNFANLRTTLKNSIVQFRAAYDKEMVDRADAFITALYKMRFSAPEAQVEIDKEITQTLRTFITESDSVVINAVNELIPGAQLGEMYLKYCNTASKYAESIELILNVIQRLELSVVNILKWKADANNLTAAILTNDLIEIRNAINQLSSEEAREMLSNNAASLLDSIEYHFAKESGSPFFEQAAKILSVLLDGPAKKDLILNYQRHKRRILGK